MTFVPMHGANAGDEAAGWRDHNDLTERQVEPLHSWLPGDGRAGTMGSRPAWRFQSRALSVPTPRETGKLTVTQNVVQCVTASKYRNTVRRCVKLVSSYWSQSPGKYPGLARMWMATRGRCRLGMVP